MMSESRGNGRRTSARLGDKEDLPVTNGIGHDYEPEKKNRGKAAGGKQEKVAVNGASTKASAKRKQGEQPNGEEGLEAVLLLARSKCSNVFVNPIK